MRDGLRCIHFFLHSVLGNALRSICNTTHEVAFGLRCGINEFVRSRFCSLGCFWSTSSLFLALSAFATMAKAMSCKLETVAVLPMSDQTTHQHKTSKPRDSLTTHSQ